MQFEDTKKKKKNSFVTTRSNRILMMGKYFWSKLDVQRTHSYVVIENTEDIQNTFNEVSLQFSTMGNCCKTGQV